LVNQSASSELSAPVEKDHQFTRIGAAVRACKRDVRTTILVEVGHDRTSAGSASKKWSWLEGTIAIP
jgi:hypothetical protein